MNEHLSFVEEKRLQRVKAALEKNNMEAYIVNSAAEVVPLVSGMLAKGATVANGGSVTLAQCGVMDLLRSGSYNFLDRDAPGADVQVIFRQAFSADAYLASANAITENGEIYEMDGNSNRVAAMAFGPASVIVVAGRNKIVPDVAAAKQRNARFAAPANCHRLGCATPCATTGECVDCASPGRICCTEVIFHQQRVKGRFKVILVNEELGY